MRRVCAACAIVVSLALPIQALALCLDAKQSDCCNGTMCPMHHTTPQESSCDMGMSQQNAQVQPCPVHTPHYAAALPFVLFAPLELVFDRVYQTALLAPSIAPENIDLDIVAPPPRTIHA